MKLDDLDPDSPEYDAALEAAQQAADGETSAPDAPAGDAAEPAAPADPDITTDTPADPEAAPAAVVDAGATDPVQPEKVAGVASKDGGRVLPYSALQAERRSARAASARAERAEREAVQLRQELADRKAGKVLESDTLSDEDLAALEENFPEQAKKVRAVMEQAKAAEASRPPAVATPQSDDAGDDPIEEAIDQVPLLADWRHSDPEKFGRAAQIDAVLQSSPKWRDKPLAERFAHVARQVADEFDIPVPQAVQAQKPSLKPATPDPRPVVDKAPRASPNTLSDFKGGTVADHGTADYSRMSPQSMLGKFADMSDDQIDAILARQG